MFFLTIISETLLYLCFSLLIGAYIFAIIPTNRKPAIYISSSIKLLAVLGITILSFIPLIQIITHLSQAYGFGSAAQTVLLSFKIGNAWLFTFILSIVLGFYITLTDDNQDKKTAWGGLALVVFLAIGVAWSSHAGSVEGIYGVFIHAMHFIAVIIWVGCLLLVSWFAKDLHNWNRFLTWFHPTAIACFLFIMISGLLLMNAIINFQQYTDSYLVSYGQSLLIKHLFILPLFIYAFINGYWMKKKLTTDSTFNPKPWVRAEFLIILLIFIVTGVMNEQSPPFQIENLIQSSGYAPILEMFYHGPIDGNQVTLMWNSSTIFFAVIALCLTISMYVFKTKMSATLSFMLALCLVLTTYITFIQSIIII
ncbi:copper resistance D family protein [Virgibacillus salexigens]|uniref:copper resistance D family protein n=1 Tax=Virgibacillus salexigens TaxID=61016 RepID=UPI003081EE9F